MLNQKYFFAYASQITLASTFHRKTFGDIEQTANIKNQRTGITGFLLFKGGNFFQYFEGDEIACRHLLASVKSDKRHTNVHVIAEGVIEKTLFDKWFMCCFDMDSTHYDFNTDGILEDFDPATWQIHEVKQVIELLSTQHVSTFPIPMSSYAKLRVKQFGNQHKIFLLLQLILLLLITIAVLDWVIRGH